MIHDLDSTLRVLLQRELPAPLNRQIAISFDPPDDQFPPQGVALPAIDLFLYDIRENRELRSNEYLEVRSSEGTATYAAAIGARRLLISDHGMAKPKRTKSLGRRAPAAQLCHGCPARSPQAAGYGSAGRPAQPGTAAANGDFAAGALAKPGRILAGHGRKTQVGPELCCYDRRAAVCGLYDTACHRQRYGNRARRRP